LLFFSGDVTRNFVRDFVGVLLAFFKEIFPQNSNWKTETCDDRDRGRENK